MDEDVGVKAPVTRLRRRLSVEQSEDAKSPAPSTPTKKRGGRLAAIPQLELINENAAAPENSPVKRTTRKSIARDIVEEEKPLTPGRRSTRIKSNTSIVSETPQSFDSPRAKRAARRTSQLGSDNEAPMTPARTRRGRKDSTSSIDKPAVENTPASIQIVEPINEEPENESHKSTNNEELNSSSQNLPTTVRKSPRIQAKKGNNSKQDNDLNTSKSNTVSEESSQNSVSTQDVTDSATKSPQAEKFENQTDHKFTSSQRKDNSEAKEKPTDNNKSISIEDRSLKSKRNRTKSWTNIAVSPSNDSSFLSDNEGKKKKVANLNKSIDMKSLFNKSGSGDSQQDDSTAIIITSKTNRLSESRHDKSVKESSILNNSNSDKENMLDGSPLKANPNTTALLFDEEPSNELQTIVFIEDSDSKSSTDSSKQYHVGDQCVPVVNQFCESLNKQNLDIAQQDAHNDSCEPMDIDETIPENTSLIIDDDSDANNKSINKSKRKSSISVPFKSLNASKTTNESCNKSFAQMQNESVSMFNQSQSLNKSKQKSSINLPKDNETTMMPSKEINESLNKSKRKSSVSQTQDKSIVTDSSEPGNDIRINKSLRKSSVSNTNEPDNMDSSKLSKRKSSLSQAQDTSVNQSPILNKSKRKSSLNLLENHETSKSEQNETNENQNTEIDTIDSSEPSKRKSSNSHAQNITEITSEENNSTMNKSKRKSSISQSFNDNNLATELVNVSLVKSNKNDSRKSKRKSSLSQLEKTDTENKSTLVLSQYKDISNDENSELMSKSLNITDFKENIIVNKNLSINNCLTSTPLQQKNVPEINLEKSASKSMNESKLKKSKEKSKKDVSLMCVDAESDNDESDLDENTSYEKIKLLDDEAQEASDDYESGDSQDEEEKRYVEENEIVERGVTLTSDDEFSDDTDYEKDSFIVTSDEEDDELLSGSGDDLSMSDNELNMTAKSKKKYNERKLKEQKQASREMFESRHKLNTSNKSDKSDKNKGKNRRRLDSTLLKSEDDENEIIKKKKSNRLRLNSTQESNASQSEADESVNLKKKKKTKRLSESVCNESNLNEIEITICNNNAETSNDPLSSNIKQEPKTPVKDFNLSTIYFSDREEIEQVAVSGNMSVVNANETSDPLQATMVDEDDSSSMSENQEIAVNYDSMLNELNKATKGQLKTHDISLNSNKKAKQANKDPIIDQLNLTQTKKIKISKKPAKVEESAQQPNTDVANVDEGSSDSIDMKLLFPDDSNDSEKADVDDFIPLRKSVGKTNIRESLDQNKSLNQSSLNQSLNKKKKHNSSACIEEPTVQNISLDQSSLNESMKKKKRMDKKRNTSVCPDEPKDEPETEVLFVVDTEGANADMNTSLSKKKKKKNSISLVNKPELPNEEEGKGSVADISLSKKNKKSSISLAEEPETPNAEEAINSAVADTSVSKKKNKKNGITLIENTDTPNEDDFDGPLEVSFKSEKNSKKARKLSGNAADSLAIEPEHVEEIKSKKRKHNSSNTEDSALLAQDSSGTEITNKKKKKISQDAPVLKEELNKKRQKRKERDDDDNKTVSKVLKNHSFDDVHVPRLPTTILNKLADKPNKDLLAKKKTSVVSTTNFVVEETRKRRNKPSAYLEESIYLNDDTPPKKTQKAHFKIPKVLPFIPTASTSDCGSTTNFEIKIIPQPTAFVAQPIEMANFKKEYLQKKVKKHGTYELYKKNRNCKLSKF